MNLLIEMIIVTFQEKVLIFLNVCIFFESKRSAHLVRYLYIYNNVKYYKANYFQVLAMILKEKISCSLYIEYKSLCHLAVDIQ